MNNTFKWGCLASAIALTNFMLTIAAAWTVKLLIPGLVYLPAIFFVVGVASLICTSLLFLLSIISQKRRT